MHKKIFKKRFTLYVFLIALQVILLIFFTTFFILRQNRLKPAKQGKEIKYFDVKIMGEVKFPGTYRVMKGTELASVLNYAGGYTENAVRDLAEQTKIDRNRTFLVKTDTKGKITKTYNLNTVTYRQLVEIPKITEEIATNILVKQRTTQFKSVEELLEIKGIGPKTFEQIKPYFFAD